MWDWENPLFPYGLFQTFAEVNQMIPSLCMNLYDIRQYIYEFMVFSDIKNVRYIAKLLLQQNKMIFQLEEAIHAMYSR